MTTRTLKISIDSDAGEHSVTHSLEGNQAEQLEKTLEAFEDVLATHFEIDPMVNSLDIVESVALLD